jgi:hypothetical protein
VGRNLNRHEWICELVKSIEMSLEKIWVDTANCDKIRGEMVGAVQ